MDFALRAGEVTLARISQTTGTLRLVIGRGEMLNIPKPFSGTSGTLKMDLGAHAFLDLLMHEGLEHHLSLVYGDHTASLHAYARLIQMPVLKMEKEVN
jgi:L-fucose isomerase-like protein